MEPTRDLEEDLEDVLSWSFYTTVYVNYPEHFHMTSGCYMQSWDMSDPNPYFERPFNDPLWQVIAGKE